MSAVIRIGTRGSVLALTQARLVKKSLAKTHPKLRFELVVVKTTGDKFLSTRIFQKGGTGLFTKELEKKLLNNAIDVAVHSLKDLPTRLPKKLCLAAVTRRLDARDVIVSRKKWNLWSIPFGARVATGSPRRKRQLAIFRPDLRLIDLRGNLDSRIRQVLNDKKFDAIVVAQAGIHRLGRYQRYACAIDPELMLPAVGQGSIGLETRTSDPRTRRLLRAIHHTPTEKIMRAERRFLETLRGGCRVPVGIHSEIRSKTLFLTGGVFSIGSSEFIKSCISGPMTKAESIGHRLAKQLLKRGARRFLKEARSA